MSKDRANYTLTRRAMIALAGYAAVWPLPAFSATPRRIRWEDLLPDGLEYGEIIGTGYVDAVSDIWIPEFDENGMTLNTALDGEIVTLAGYIIPLDFTEYGTTGFVLVPFIGACIHVPPPPPNQLVFVTTARPWPSDRLWEAVLVTGTLQANIQRTDIAQVGYEIDATLIEKFQR